VAMAGSLLNMQTENCTAGIEFATRRGEGQLGARRERNRRRARRAVPLRDELAGGLGEDFCVKVDVGFRGGGAH
jgi:hypothetical protein